MRTAEEKRKDFLAKAEKNKENFELHKKLILERWASIPYDEEILRMMDYAESYAKSVRQSLDSKQKEELRKELYMFLEKRMPTQSAYEVSIQLVYTIDLYLLNIKPTQFSSLPKYSIEAKEKILEELKSIEYHLKGEP